MNPEIISKLMLTCLYILGGYFIRRWLDFPTKWVARSLFYVFVPLVVFKGVVYSDVRPFLTLVFLSFFVSILMVISAGFFTKRFVGTLPPGMLRCAFGYFNIGWFGIPIAQALYGMQGVVALIGLYIGGMLFGNTLGFLLIASDQSKKINPIRGLSKIPSLYLVCLGFLANFIGFREWLMKNEELNFILKWTVSITSVLGMALIGMNIADMKIRHTAWKKISLLLGARFLTVSIIVGVLFAILSSGEYLNPLELKVFQLMPLFPIAANILVFSNSTGSQDSSLGLVLLISTLFSCLLLALIYSWGFQI